MHNEQQLDKHQSQESGSVTVCEPSHENLRFWHAQLVRRCVHVCFDQKPFFSNYIQTLSISTCCF